MELLVTLAVVGVLGFVAVALAIVRTVSPRRRHAGPLVKVLILVVVAWRLMTWVF